MNKFFGFLTFASFAANNLFAAEEGMPQLDPTYWASQVFWLTIIFASIYFLIAKIFIPKIKNNIDSRENKIRKDIEEAALLKEDADKKLKQYNDLIEEAKLNARKIHFAIFGKLPFCVFHFPFLVCGRRQKRAFHSLR